MIEWYCCKHISSVMHENYILSTSYHLDISPVIYKYDYCILFSWHGIPNPPHIAVLYTGLLDENTSLIKFIFKFFHIFCILHTLLYFPGI